MYIHTCMHTHTGCCRRNTHTHTHTHTRHNTYIHTHVYIYNIHTYIHTNIYTCMHTHTGCGRRKSPWRTPPFLARYRRGERMYSSPWPSVLSRVCVCVCVCVCARVCHTDTDTDTQTQTDTDRHRHTPVQTLVAKAISGWRRCADERRARRHDVFSSMSSFVRIMKSNRYPTISFSWALHSYVYMYVWMYVYIDICIYNITCNHIQYICVCLCLSVCLSVCVRVWIFTHLYLANKMGLVEEFVERSDTARELG
jgi:hypothetical protein